MISLWSMIFSDLSTSLSALYRWSMSQMVNKWYFEPDPKVRVCDCFSVEWSCGDCSLLVSSFSWSNMFHPKHCDALPFYAGILHPSKEPQTQQPSDVSIATPDGSWTLKELLFWNNYQRNKNIMFWILSHGHSFFNSVHGQAFVWSRVATDCRWSITTWIRSGRQTTSSPCQPVML